MYVRQVILGAALNQSSCCWPLRVSEVAESGGSSLLFACTSTSLGLICRAAPQWLSILKTSSCLWLRLCPTSSVGLSVLWKFSFVAPTPGVPGSGQGSIYSQREEDSCSPWRSPRHKVRTPDSRLPSYQHPSWGWGVWWVEIAPPN